MEDFGFWILDFGFWIYLNILEGKRMRKQIRPAVVFVAIAVFCLLSFVAIAPGRTSVVESRLLQVENQVSFLRSDLRRLESSVRRLERAANRIDPADVDPPRSSDSPSLPPTESMFDNLAILAIELKERVTQLEAKVASLEAATDSQRLHSPDRNGTTQ